MTPPINPSESSTPTRSAMESVMELMALKMPSPNEEQEHCDTHIPVLQYVPEPFPEGIAFKLLFTILGLPCL